MKASKKFLWTITWLLLIHISAQAQGWEREYDYDEISISGLNFLLDLSNGEHVVIGSSRESIISSDNSIFLFKIDETGDTLWLQKDMPSDKDVTGATVVNGGIVYAAASGRLSNNTRASQITKVDLDGNTLWSQIYSGPIAGDIAQTSDNGVVLTDQNGFGTSAFPDSIRVTKLDSGGNLVWANKYFGTSSELGSQVVGLSDGSIVVAAYIVGSSSDTFILLKLDENGVVIWKNYYTDFNFKYCRAFITTANGDLVAIGEKSVARFDELGNLLWVEDFDVTRVGDIKELPNGNFALTTRNSLQNDSYFSLHNLTPSGDENWVKSYIRPLVDLWNSQINCTTDDGFLIGVSAMVQLPVQDTFPMVFKVNGLGELYNTQLLGQVWNDENDDCLNTLDETALEGWVVAATNSENMFYGIVDEQGNYNIEVDTGDYIVSVLEPFNYWEPCIDSIFQTIMPFDTIEIDFPMQGLVDCPLLTVDISTNVLTRCFSNTYYVNYCNDGTVTAEDAFIEIDFDLDLQVDSASLMWSSVNGNIYTFPVGDLPINTCGNFVVHTTLDPDCDATVLGETHCVEAHIFPDSFCLFDPAWDESSIEVDAVCDGDSIRFQITNIGEAPMSEALEYIVIEDNVMRQMGDFDLVPGQTKEIPFASTGATVRLEAAQAAGHPGESMPNVTVEGCDPDGDGIFSLGYYTQWPDDDGSPQISIECLENVGSYDPNDKAATPEGVTENHYIRQNIDIEYKIRFQNIGTGDAMTVVVLDTLSPVLDISTLELGASSHRYQFEILTNNVLKFSFEEINLPPESVNESASQGFVKFRISQVVDNPIGTIIYNSASIFFDRNQPIITNTTYHEIGEDFIEIIIVSTKEESLSSEFIKITPNPFRQTTLITLLEGKEQDDYSLKILNSIGQVVREDKFSGLQYSFQRNNLGAGLYIFNIEKGNNLIATGKIIIQ